jgi:hypothetical protein
MTDSLVKASNGGRRAVGAESAARRGGSLAITDAPELLSNIGYLLVHGSPLDHGPAYLLVAVRPRPTRAHFDPERIEYWSMGPGRSHPATLEWPIAVQSSVYSWGTIKVIDRVAAIGRFVSFGGSLGGIRDGTLSAALFRSEAPILAVGGRADAGDPLAASVVGFFARLSAACSADAQLARDVSAMTPLAVYAAYLARALELCAGDLAASMAPAGQRSMMRSELCRLRGFAGPSVTDGEALVSRLHHAQQKQ